MALLSVMSAKGAPGATTTALLLANLWPTSSLVVDADPLGGDIALRLAGEHGPLNPNQGLMSLLPAARRGLVPEMVPGHAQTALGGQQVMPGLPGPEQAVAVAPLWPELANAFGKVPGTDVFADVGQVHARSSHLVMLERADAVICVFRPTAWSVVHTRRRLEALQDILRERTSLVGMVCVAAHDQAAEAKAAIEGVTSGLRWTTDLGVIAHDRKAVVMYEGGVVYRPERSLLARSGSGVVQRLHDGLAAAGVLSGVPTPVDEASAGDEAAVDESPFDGEPGKRADRTRGRRVLRRASR
ncbi:hypothetical protein [Nocardioides sp. CER19]|uniref:hypothetical protein n=1 Tax=Nocardioides sp. CER19 TaxID=3038538 RepID=UPI00244B82F8|nr:hypothetical protein [Nocardioides sp. CER19]MDH2413232.1 hypothetical protein [Nocardioides sp. CER19]